MKLKTSRQVYNKYFTPYDINPVNSHANDCSIRALGYLSGLSWKTIYNLLFKIGKNMYNMPNSFEVLNQIVKTAGGKKCRNIHSPFKMNILEVVQISEKTQLTYIVFIYQHVLIVSKGKVIDRHIGNFDANIDYYFSIPEKIDLKKVTEDICRKQNI